jgi:ribosomal protein S5
MTFKYKAAIIKVLPASSGTGLKAGASLRSVLELAGYTNILSKIMGTNNKLNNALAAIMALSSYKVDRAKLGTLNMQEVMDIRKKNAAEAEAERAARNDRKKSRRPAEGGDASNTAGARKPGARRPAPKK